MHHIGPYRLLGALATCPVGTVWAASDSAGRRVTLAVLDPAVAGDPRWRAAFAATANTLSQADDLPVVGANHVAATPWVACAAEAGQGAGNIFTALGQHLVAAPPPDPGPADQPTVSLAGQLPALPEPPDSGPEPPTVALAAPDATTTRPTGPAAPVSGQPAQVSAPPAPVSGGPVSGGPALGGPVSGGPVAGGPVSGGPASPAAEPPSWPPAAAPPAQAAPSGP
ncbi:hypothetical protein AAFH96_37020, partial [Polymorphospora sp. 2-325]